MFTGPADEWHPSTASRHLAVQKVLPPKKFGSRKSQGPALKYPDDALWIDEFVEMGAAPEKMLLANGRSSAEMRNDWFFLISKALVQQGWDRSKISCPRRIASCQRCQRTRRGFDRLPWPLCSDENLDSTHINMTSGDSHDDRH